MSEKHEICWGKVIAGAAIGAGAIVVASFALPALAMTAAAAPATGITGWIATHVLAAAATVLAHPAISIGVGAATGAAAADLLDRRSECKEAQIENAIVAERNQSFAVREEMRKAQALMVARMQAADYQPAMAMGR